MKKLIILAPLLFFLMILIVKGEKLYHKTTKPLTNDNFNYIATNEIKMWVSNNGDGSHDPNPDGPGFYWPGGEDATKTGVYEDGLVFAGIEGDSVKMNGNTHRQGLQAGKILPDGSADDPTLEKYRVYRIRRDWELLPPGPERDAFERDYDEWPVEDGAPWEDVNLDGIYTQGVDHPKYFGDETLWYVANGLNPGRSKFLHGSPPMGLEFQTTIYGYDRTDFFKDVVFKKYLFINKGDTQIDSMFIGYWTDDDLGEAVDDAVGCDTLLHLGFTYNVDNNDDIYGTPPPVVGHMFVQGPIVPSLHADSARFRDRRINGFKNLGITAFTVYINRTEYLDPSSGVYEGSLEYYNNLNGYFLNGDPYIDPHTGMETNFVLPGDPTTGTNGGWHFLNWPNGPASTDVRFVMASGPFTMAVGDTQEVVIAIFMAIGDDYIDSVIKLKETAVQIHQFFETDIVNSANEDKTVLPQDFSLSQNYPNPFNPSTKIKFSLPKAEKVKVELYNTLGQRVETILNQQIKAGHHEVEFKAGNLSSGVYFFKIEAGEFQDVKKMILLR